MGPAVELLLQIDRRTTTARNRRLLAALDLLRLVAACFHRHAARWCTHLASGHATVNPVIPAMKSRRITLSQPRVIAQFRLPTQAHQNRNLRSAKCDEMVC